MRDAVRRRAHRYWDGPTLELFRRLVPEEFQRSRRHHLAEWPFSSHPCCRKGSAELWC